MLKNFAGIFLLANLVLLPLRGLSQGSTNTELAIQWSYRIGAHSASSPALGPDGTLYFGTFDGKLWALSPQGKPKWIFQANREIQSSPAVGAEGTLYFGCRDRKLYAVGADGKKRWEFQTGAWVDSSPAIAGDGTIYFGSWDKNLYALKPDGTKKWLFQTAGEIVSSPAIGLNGRIFFGSHDGKFYALEPDGTKAWEFATGGPILSSPALDKDGTVYFTAVDGFFYALNPNGSVRWRLHTGGATASSPVIGPNGTLYVGVNRQLWAISSEGKRIGEFWNDGAVETTPEVFADGSVCSIDSWGYLKVFAPNGQLQGSFFLYGGLGPATPAVGPSGTLFIQGRWTNVFALQATAPLAPSSWPKFRGNAQNTGNIVTTSAR